MDPLGFFLSCVLVSFTLRFCWVFGRRGVNNSWVFQIHFLDAHCFVDKLGETGSQNVSMCRVVGFMHLASFRSQKKDHIV